MVSGKGFNEENHFNKKYIALVVCGTIFQEGMQSRLKFQQQWSAKPSNFDKHKV